MLQSSSVFESLRPTLSFVPPAFQVLLAVVVVAAAVTDVRSRRIPNALVLMGALFGLGLNWFAYGLPGLLHSAKGLGLAFAIYLPFFLLRAMGAGDVKLMGAIGAIVGPSNWFGIFLLSAISGGILAIVVMVSRGRFRRTVFNIAYILDEIVHIRAPHASRSDLNVRSPEAVTLPHGFSIAVGAILFLVASWIWAPR